MNYLMRYVCGWLLLPFFISITLEDGLTKFFALIEVAAITLGVLSELVARARSKKYDRKIAACRALGGEVIGALFPEISDTAPKYIFSSRLSFKTIDDNPTVLASNHLVLAPGCNLLDARSMRRTITWCRVAAAMSVAVSVFALVVCAKTTPVSVIVLIIIGGLGMLALSLSTLDFVLLFFNCHMVCEYAHRGYRLEIEGDEVSKEVIIHRLVKSVIYIGKIDDDKGLVEFYIS